MVETAPPIEHRYVKTQSSFKDYVSLARPDHWFKNIFMVPGVIFALLYFDVTFSFEIVLRVIIGVVATCLIASSNYVINEWLDAEFDKYHPKKKFRPSVTKRLTERYVYLQYGGLAIVGLGLSLFISIPFFLFELIFLVMGFMYNVKPFRTKDRVYLDVLTESINNPIRFALGWYIFVPLIMPPSSMMVAYWMGGAFLMATKRFSEYRFINDSDLASLYRKSFKYYNEMNLLVSIFFYALTSSFFLGIFLIKNRIELLLSFPLFALLFAWYLKIGFQEDSPAQKPESLYKQKYFMYYLTFMCLIILILLYVNIEPLHWFLHNNFVK